MDYQIKNMSVKIKTFKKDELNVEVFDSRAEMGRGAAKAVGAKIVELLSTKNEISIIFAAAPSQNEFLAALLLEDVAWDRINAFHMDEYIGLPANAPQGFANFLSVSIFDHANFKTVNFLNGTAKDLTNECDRYASLLSRQPIDIVCMGIGENTHVAFNDPHVADFKDQKLVKVVDLDLPCRQQQVNDGCFAHIDEVPTHALTLTVPALFNAHHIYCVVPGSNKAQAIAHTLNDEVTERYPSTVLRKHANAILFIDKKSAEFI